MSYDLSYGEKFFTIGYSAEPLLKKIFSDKIFWFSDLDGKTGEESSHMILDALCKIEHLPTEGEEYSRERYHALVEQLGFMYKLVQDNPEETWEIGL